MNVCCYRQNADDANTSVHTLASAWSSWFRRCRGDGTRSSRCRLWQPYRLRPVCHQLWQSHLRKPTAGIHACTVNWVSYRTTAILSIRLSLCPTFNPTPDLWLKPIELFGMVFHVKDTHYNLRQRSHSLALPSEDNNLSRKIFLYRMLFRDIY